MLDAVAFIDACYEGDLNTIQKYIESGYDVDNPSPLNGNTGLRAACEVDKVDVAEMLLSSGADPNLRIYIKSMIENRYICEDAVAIFYCRSMQMVDLLIGKKADISVTDKYGDGVIVWWEKLGVDEALIKKYL